ncbi:MAG: long-chain fatty acid--CoA ligase [Pseudomonadota bacterium]
MKTNIGLLLAKRAFITPNLEALVDVATERRFTYAELNQRCNRTANFLLEIGVQKGDRVGMLMMNSAEFIETYFALAKIGAVIVPLNWRLVPDELSFILKDSGTKFLIYSDDFNASAAELQERGAEGSPIQAGVHVGSPDNRLDFAQDYAALQSAALDEEPEARAEDDDLLYIMYTSGTTGLPKGVVHTHKTSFWGLLTMNATADLRLKDRYLLVLPLFHVGALTPGTGCVYGGVTMIILRAFDPTLAWELFEKEKITTALAVPAMLNFMLQVPDFKKYDYSQLRWIMSGASPVPESLIETYADVGIEIHQVYGLTESCGPACLISPEDALTKIGSTGKAFMHTEIRVVDPDGNDVPEGVPGEVIVRGEHIMKEYWNRPDATADTIKDGWLYSGDVAVWDNEGFVYIQDRIKDMIISGGENVYPAEIENVILAHPKVKEVAVIGQESKKWGESPLAVVVTSDDSLTEDEVLAHCSGKLARFKMPRAAVFIEEIPRNPTGKVLKRLLRDQFPDAAPE